LLSVFQVPLLPEPTVSSKGEDLDAPQNEQEHKAAERDENHPRGDG